MIFGIKTSFTFFAGILVITSCGAKESDRIGRRMAPSLFSDPESVDGDATAGTPSDDVLPEDEDAEYKKLLKSCGGIDPENPYQLVLDQPMKAFPVRQSGTETIVIPIRYTVDFDGDLLIQSSINKNEITRSFNLIDIKPALAGNMARDRLAAQSGGLVTDYVPYADRSALADLDPVWNGVTCTIQPAIKTINTVGGRVVATYSRPLPIHISPIALKERYDLELNIHRRWELTATILESTHPSLRPGTVIPGIVEIEPAANHYDVTLPDGRFVNINSDVGIRIKIQFGNDATTNLMGLTPDSTYLVDNLKRRFHAISADLRDGATPVVTFVTPEALP